MIVKPARIALTALAVALAGVAMSATSSRAAAPPNAVRGTDGVMYATWDSARFTMQSQTWTNLPGARVPKTVAAKNGFRLYVIHFDGDAECLNPSNNGVCSVRILVGGRVAAPGGTNSRFITSRGGGEWSAHGYTRIACLNLSSAPQNATTQVQLLATSGSTFGVQNWTLTVERFKMADNATCP